MNIAILGGSSEIARDLVLKLGYKYPEFNVYLYTRNPEKLKFWLSLNYSGENIKSEGYEKFGNPRYKSFDIIINFVGAGDPAKLKKLGQSILDITNYYDSIAIDYLKKVNNCKYIFISSGAVYGDNFNNPIQCYSESILKVKDCDDKSYYSLAKLYSEYKHRALKHLQISDLRVFNYFSHTQDLRSSFFISEIMRSIISGKKFVTSRNSIFRDYISPADFFQIIECIIFNNDKNIAFDCYTINPVEKFELLNELKKRYFFDYEVMEIVFDGNYKKNYYSKNKIAENIGYVPSMSSLTNILEQVNLLLCSRAG